MTLSIDNNSSRFSFGYARSTEILLAEENAERAFWIARKGYRLLGVLVGALFVFGGWISWSENQFTASVFFIAGCVSIAYFLGTFADRPAKHITSGNVRVVFGPTLISYEENGTTEQRSWYEYRGRYKGVNGVALFFHGGRTIWLSDDLFTSKGQREEFYKFVDECGGSIRIAIASALQEKPLLRWLYALLGLFGRTK